MWLTPTAEENHFYLVRRGQLSLCSQVPLPWCPSHVGASILHGVWRVLTAADVGKATQQQGVPDHQVLPITGAQHTQAFCLLFWGFTAHAVCQCAPPRPFGGSWQVCAFSVCFTRALLPGLGCYVPPACDPFGGAYVVMRRVGQLRCSYGGRVAKVLLLFGGGG